MSNVILLADAAYNELPPEPSAQNPFRQVEWIFNRRASRVRSDSGKENYRNAATHYVKYLEESVGRIPYTLKDRWEILSLIMFKNWLFAQDSLGSHSRVSILSAVRQTMLEAVALGQTATLDIANATAPEGYRETDILALRTDTTLKPTEETLVILAKCSRGTLRNRGWPIEALKAIKKERRNKKSSAATSPAKLEPQKPPSQAHADQLKLARDETLRWKMKHDDLVQAVATLADAVDSLKATEAKLQIEVLELRTRVAQGRRGMAAVIPVERKKGPLR